MISPPTPSLVETSCPRPVVSTMPTMDKLVRGSPTTPSSSKSVPSPANTLPSRAETTTTTATTGRVNKSLSISSFAHPPTATPATTVPTTLSPCKTSWRCTSRPRWMPRNTTVRWSRKTATVRTPTTMTHARLRVMSPLALTTARITTRTITTTTRTRPISLTSKGLVNVRRWKLTRTLFTTTCRKTVATATTCTVMTKARSDSSSAPSALPMESLSS
mmetsp:Transcript_3615/g.5493  ORF Transcript_3615/g.5493 Transcript_3615/m.5493 type:complete len:218 (+) Transcript_3615:110-763(+)